MEPPEDCRAESSPRNVPRQCCAYCMLFSGSAVLILGTGLFFAWPSIFSRIFNQELVLNNSSMSFNFWKETPIPMYLEIHMFNWTNPEESLKGALPNFVEVGPYVFTEHHTKVNLNWNPNDTITFRQIRKYIFVPELSNGSLSDQITSINVIATTIGQLIKKIKYLRVLEPEINWVIQKFETLVYVKKTVKEFLFDGYDDTFLDIANELQKLHLIGPLPFDKFGWFYMRNNSAIYDGVFVMQTGASSLSELGEITRWNYKPQSTSYSGPCGIIQGSTGELWPVDAAMRRNIMIFAPDLCSTISLSNTTRENYVGLQGHRHHGDRFDNGQISKDSSCFCVTESCPPIGTRDISSCRYGVPVYISYPHFYLADSSYLAGVSGMTPNREKHEFYLTLENNTGIPLEVHARMQINIRIEPIPNLKFFDGLPKAYLPVLWFDQRASLTPRLALLLQIIFAARTILAVFAWLGLSVLLIAIILLRERLFYKNIVYSSLTVSSLSENASVSSVQS